MKTENLSTLQLNLLSNEQFRNALTNEKIDPNAFYLTPEENLFIRYAYDAEPTELFDTWAEGMSYIGFAYAEEAPTSYADYSWSLFVGADGKEGQPGQSVHIRYSEYEDGTEFTDTWSAGQSYIGFAVATEAPTNKDEYTWSMFVSNIRYTQTVILEVDQWVDNKQTVQITGIADNTTVTATPSPASQEIYLDAGIYLQEASVGHATFACHQVPSSDVSIEVVILDSVGSVGGSGGEIDSAELAAIKADGGIGYETKTLIIDKYIRPSSPENVKNEPNKYWLPICINFDSTKVYDVTLNGVTTRHKPMFLMGIGYIGNLAGLLGEPNSSTDNFTIYTEPGEEYSILATFNFTAEDYVEISVTEVQEIHEINHKYLPEGVGYTIVSNSSHTLEWDGTDSDVSISVEISNGAVTASVDYHRVYDEPVDIMQIIGGSITTVVQGDAEIITEDAVDGVIGSYYAVFSTDGTPIIAICCADNTVIDFNGASVQIPRRGIYFAKAYGYALVTSLTLPAYTFSRKDVHKIDSKYISFIEEDVLVDTQAEFEWSDDFGPCAIVGLNNSLIVGETYRVIIDDAEYVRKAKSDLSGSNQLIYLGASGESDPDEFSILNHVVYGIAIVSSWQSSGYHRVKISKQQYAKIPTECVDGALPKVTLTTPVIMSTESVELTEAESDALSLVAESGKPVIIEGLVNNEITAIVAYNVGKHILMSDVLNVATVLFELNSDTKLWTIRWQIDDTDEDIDLLEIALTQRIENLENFIEGMKTMAENPANEGKYFGVKNEKVDILDPPSNSLPTVTAADNGKFLQVVDGAIALVSVLDASKEGL